MKGKGAGAVVRHWAFSLEGAVVQDDGTLGGRSWRLIVAASISSEIRLLACQYPNQNMQNRTGGLKP